MRLNVVIGRYKELYLFCYDDFLFCYKDYFKKKIDFGISKIFVGFF